MNATDETATLGDFILQEMQTRDMSAREFAQLVGVSHSVINRFLNHGKTETYAGSAVGEPSVDFLIKLAQATHVDIRVLVGLVAPQATNLNPKAELLAERIARLSPEDQDLVDRFIIGTVLQNRNKRE